MKHFLSADIVNEICFILNVEYLLFPYAFLYPFHLPFVIIWCDRTALLHRGKDTHSSAIFYSQRWCNSLLHFLLCLLLRLLLFCILQEFLIYFIFRCVLSSCCLCALLIFLRFSHFPWNFLQFFFRGGGGAGFVKRQFVMQFMCIQMRYIWAKLFISNSFRWGYSNSARAPVAFNHAPQRFSLVQLSYVVVNLYINIYMYCVCIQIQLSGCEISINCWPDKHYGAFINLQRLCIKCALKSFNICKVRLSMVNKAWADKRQISKGWFIMQKALKTCIIILL